MSIVRKLRSATRRWRWRIPVALLGGAAATWTIGAATCVWGPTPRATIFSTRADYNEVRAFGPGSDVWGMGSARNVAMTRTGIGWHRMEDDRRRYPDAIVGRSLSSTRYSFLAVTEREIRYDADGVPVSLGGEQAIRTNLVAAGWPWHTVVGGYDVLLVQPDGEDGRWTESVSPWRSYVIGTLAADGTSADTRVDPRVIPLGVLPLPFLGATLMWGAVILAPAGVHVLLVLGRTIRRRRRSRSGRFVDCGYPLSASGVARCPECGVLRSEAVSAVAGE